MEEYDWGEFAVITSLLPGYDTFVDIVETYTDTSYFLWNVQDVLSLEMSVGASEAKTKRLLQQVPANRTLIFPPRDFKTTEAARRPCYSLLSPFLVSFPSVGLSGPAGLLFLR